MTGARYLDTAATTRVDERVAALVVHYMIEEFGNAGSRTHQRGATAKHAVERAREQVADVIAADPSDVVFTSGATESNNIAILGSQTAAAASGRRHFVTTAIEHKAVLEPFGRLEAAGFEVTIVPSRPDGTIDPEEVVAATRDDTFMVSMMAVNNETGVIQDVTSVAEGLPPRVWLHVDAAQGFGKLDAALRHPRLDLMSVSAHKLFAPKGVGALISRRRDRRRAPLEPLMLGGGQEFGLRPGTQSVPLIVGFGEAARLAKEEAPTRTAAVARVRARALDQVARIGAAVNGSGPSVGHIVNVQLPLLDAEAAMLIVKEVANISNGSACTSTRFEPSHVLLAMGLDVDACLRSIRISWDHDTNPSDLDPLFEALGSFS